MLLSNDARPLSIDISEVSITNFNGTEKTDVTAMIREMSMYEDIFAPGISLDIQMVDTQGLRSELPIIGDEIINLVFKTPNENRDVVVELRTYAVSDIFQDKDRAQSYTIKAASPHIVLDQTLVVDRAYNELTISNILEKIFDEYIKPATKKRLLSNQATLGLQSIVFPKISPMKAIKYLSHEAMSLLTEPSATFLFYEHHDGFEFRTLESLSSSEPIETYYFVPAGFERNLGARQKVKDSQKIIDLRQESFVDILDTLNIGYYGGTTSYIDPIRKNFKTFTYDYSSSFDKISRVDGKKTLSPDSRLLKGAAETSYRYIITSRDRSSIDYSVADPSDPREIFFPRRRQDVSSTKSAMFLQNIRTVRITVTVPGYSKIRAGVVVELAIPQMSETQDAQNNESLFESGEYIVSSVNHTVKSTGEYFTVMECIKPAFASQPERVVL